MYRKLLTLHPVPVIKILWNAGLVGFRTTVYKTKNMLSFSEIDLRFLTNSVRSLVTTPTARSLSLSLFSKWTKKCPVKFELEIYKHWKSTSNFTLQFHRPLRRKLKTLYDERQMEKVVRERERETERERQRERERRAANWTSSTCSELISSIQKLFPSLIVEH